MQTVKEKEKKAYEIMKSDFDYKNQMETPRLSKVVISTGVGSIDDKNQIEVIKDRLSKITGQKPSPRRAKQSIAGFKLREGDVVGYQVTLRGSRMYAFMDRFLAVSIPRTRDFRGVNQESVDEMGNLTIGVKEHTIFPETSNEEIKDVFGLSVTLVSTAQNKKEAQQFFEAIGVPFKKNKEGK